MAAKSESGRPASARGRAGSSRSGAGAKGKAGRKRRFDYPRAGKGRVRRWLPSWRVVLGTVLTGAAVVIGVVAAAYMTTDIPEPGDFAQAQGTTVYFADGETEMGSFAEYNRESVDLATLPEHVGHAVVASEDRRFYENVGVDPIAIGRALWNNLRGNATQGGSTLTQQYVERYYLGTTTSYTGKFREAILALKIDRELSKDEILEDYLNTIYFGRNAYGIETAAQAYFGKPAAELTLSESALLAGVIPAPSAWDPASDPERAEQRWERTLEFMVRDGWITEAEAAEQTFPETIEHVRSDTYAGPTGYLLDMVRKELVAKADMTEEQIDTLGLRITTTIDAEAQQAAVDVVDALPEDRPDNNRVALVSMDPQSGAIVALYGGPDFVSQSRNAATQDVAQAGSTFKPFTLVAALREDIPLSTRYPSYTPMEIEGFDRPVNNYDAFNRGQIDLIEATEQSVNTTYAQLNIEVGPEKSMQAAIDAGLPEDTAGLAPVPSNVLGPASPHPIDMARAYATFAAQGVRHTPYIVAEVVDGEGNTIYAGTSNGTEVFEPDVMAEATYAMTTVIEEGTGVRASSLGRPAAGKTGTSNEGRSAWFAGYVPQLATVVAMYQVGEDGTEESLTPFGEYASITGSTYPTTMWRDFMSVALEGVEVEEFPDRPEPETPTFVPAPQPEPTTEEPTTEEPTTEEPTTEEPTTEEPTTEEPTTEEPTTEEPTTQAPTPSPTPTEPADGEEGDGSRDGRGTSGRGAGGSAGGGGPGGDGNGGGNGSAGGGNDGRGGGNGVSGPGG
ncbi:transglycosylase domain-containing protein [Georgenia sp. H159]|uniref:transglycosylase domain-containing protein n=1 Tax=Georgenia sp. H159 TaxID=3076115 RepID=UPI002D77B0AB|nr:transglycosylase domain-containing protein [Georgenia sp. H159]